MLQCQPFLVAFVVEKKREQRAGAGCGQRWIYRLGERGGPCGRSMFGNVGEQVLAYGGRLCSLSGRLGMHENVG